MTSDRVVSLSPSRCDPSTVGGMSAPLALPTQAGLGLGGVALPMELLGAAGDGESPLSSLWVTPPNKEAHTHGAR